MLDEAARGVERLWRQELAIGLLAGLLGAVVRSFVPGAGRVLTPGLVVALCVAWVLDAPLVAVAGAVGVVADTQDDPRLRAAAVAAAVGLAVAAAQSVAVRDPVRIALGVLVLACAAVALVSAQRAGRPAAVLALMTALGWYAGLPDVEGAVVVVGVAAGSLVAVSTFGWAGFAAAGAAVVLVGSAGRLGALVGGIVSLGWLLVPTGAPGWLARRLLVPYVVHAAFVVYGARVVGRQVGATRVLLAAAPAALLALALAVALWLTRRRPLWRT